EITETLAGAESPTLFSILDCCATSMGSRRLRHWLHHPLRDTARLRERQAVIAALVHAASPLRHAELHAMFDAWSDVERITARVALRSARPRDLAGLRDTLATLPTLHGALMASGQPGLIAAAEALRPLDEVHALLAAAVKDEPVATLREGGVIREGHDAALDELRAIQDDCSAFLLDME